MTYKQLITKKYPEIKKAVYARAFKFNLRGDELLSLVNERIAVNIHRDKFKMELEVQFWGYIQMLIYTCAVDLKRTKKQEFELLENCYKTFTLNLDERIQARDLITKIFAGITNELSRAIATEVLIHGEPYEETAKRFDVNLSTVKTIIHRLRKTANAEYLYEYKEILS